MLNLKRESAKTRLYIKCMMGNACFDSRATIYSKDKSSRMKTQLLCGRVSWRKFTIYDSLIPSHIMTQNSKLSPRVILQASCSRAKHGSEGRVSITPARWQRSRSERKEEELNAQLPDTHTETQWAEPSPGDREWCEQAAGFHLLCLSELEDICLYSCHGSAK